MNVWSIILRSLAAVALIAYPVIVWLGLSSGTPRTVALVLLCAIVPSACLRMKKSRHQEMRSLAFVPVTIVTILVLTAVLNAGNYILAIPVATNAVLLLSFGVTLRKGSKPMIERFARLYEKEMNDDQLRWVRTWTWIWCAFFVCNGAVALLLAIYAPLSWWWAFYNGMLSYALIGVLFASEWLLRHRRFPELKHDKA